MDLQLASSGKYNYDQDVHMLINMSMNILYKTLCVLNRTLIRIHTKVVFPYRRNCIEAPHGVFKYSAHNHNFFRRYNHDHSHDHYIYFKQDNQIIKNTVLHYQIINY